MTASRDIVSTGAQPCDSCDFAKHIVSQLHKPIRCGVCGKVHGPVDDPPDLLLRVWKALDDARALYIRDTGKPCPIVVDRSIAPKETAQPVDDLVDQPKVTETPETIWLVFGDIDVGMGDVHFSDCDEITWCEDSQFPSDVQYFRKDLHDANVQRLADRIEALEADLAAAQVDAERYRWLNAQGGWILHSDPIINTQLVDSIRAARKVTP